MPPAQPEGSPKSDASKPAKDAAPSSLDTIGVFNAVKHDKGEAWDAFDRKIRPYLREALRGENLPSDYVEDDLVQMTLMDALLAIDTWEAVAPRAWIRTILRNTLADLWRAKLTDKRGKGRIASLEDDPAAAARVADPRAETPSAHARFNETKALVLAAMRELRADHVMVLRLRETEGRSFSEIAAHFGITPTSARATLFRAREARKRILGRFFPQDDET